ncbi:MAG: PQQ-binding-like beta-propeller repeat protein [Pseudomonadota bacterium]
MSFRKVFSLLVYICGVCSGCDFFKDSGVVWEFKTGYPLVPTPVVSGEQVYVGSDKFYCLHSATGKPLWEFTTIGIIQSSPEVKDGHVYFQCGGLYCLDAATGKLVWEFWTDTWSDMKPVISDERIYTIIKEKAYCLDANTGQKIWDAPVSTVHSIPAVSDGHMYIGSAGRLSARDAQTGKSMWSTPLGEKDERLYLKAFQGKVYAGSSGKQFYCVDGVSGKILWTYADEYVLRRFSLAGDAVYIGNGKLYCLNAGTGALAWQSALEKPVSGIPQILDNQIYIRSLDGRIYCIDAKTGEKQGDLKSPEAGALAHGYIYTGSSQGKLYCIRLPKKSPG